MIVLAVDDERPALEVLKQELAKVNPAFQVCAFRDPAQALEFAEDNLIDIAFLDVQMFGMSGIELARKLKLRQPKINIIFTTGYSSYMKEAFELHASGYLLKPVEAGAIAAELENLRYPSERFNAPDQKSVSQPSSGSRVRIKCFGSFDIQVDGKAVSFKYEKARELLAYLVDRRGAACSSREIMTALWEDDSHGSYLRNVRKCLLDTMNSLDCGDILETDWGKIRIVPEKVDCDYYHWLAGDVSGINAWRGEYMSRYSWAEDTNARLGDP